MAPLAAVVRLAAPTTVVMAVAAVSNVVYTYFVSRLGVEAIGAVSLVFPVSILAITTMVGGIGAGASSAMARALGAERQSAAAALAGQALVLSGAIGLAFGLGMQVAAPVLFRLMGASGAVHASASRFAQVLFGGAVITFVGGMLDSVMRGEGNVRVPAIWSTTSLVLQMACTPLFMFTFHWGLVGAALAMLTCQLIATVPRALWVLGGRALVRALHGRSGHPRRRRPVLPHDRPVLPLPRGQHGDRLRVPGSREGHHPARLDVPPGRGRARGRDHLHAGARARRARGLHEHRGGERGVGGGHGRALSRDGAPAARGSAGPARRG